MLRCQYKESRCLSPNPNSKPNLNLNPNPNPNPNHRGVASFARSGGGGRIKILKSVGQRFSPKWKAFLAEITKFPTKSRWSPKKKVFAEIRRLFQAEITNFPTKSRWSQKKKGLRWDPKAFSGQNRKFLRFFRPKTPSSSQKNTVGGKKKIGGSKTKTGGHCPPLAMHLLKHYLQSLKE